MYPSTWAQVRNQNEWTETNQKENSRLDHDNWSWEASVKNWVESSQIFNIYTSLGLPADIYLHLDLYTGLPLLGGKGRKIVSVRVFNIQGGIKVRRIKTHSFNSICRYRSSRSLYFNRIVI